METNKDKLWLEKINRVNQLVLMPAVFFTFLLFNTVLNLWLNKRVETLQNIFVIVVVLIIVLNFLLKPKEILVSWVKGNYLVIAYLIVRGLSFINSGFDYSVARTIFFEMFFLIGITKLTLDSKVIKKIYLKGFLIVEFVLSIICLILYYVGKTGGEDILSTLDKYTYYSLFNSAAVYSNSNTAGLLAAFAIVIIIILYKKNWDMKIKILATTFILYNLLFLYLQDNRSGEVGIIAVVLAMFFHMIFKKVNKRSIVYMAFAFCILIVPSIYAFIGYHMTIEPKYMTQTEMKIDSISSGRYAIWKGCFIEQKEHLVLGAGNLALEQKNREELFLNPENGYGYYFSKGADLGPHNGYIGLVSGAGWLGLILFMAILLQRVRRAQILNKGNWYLAIVFILAINLFESLFILNRFFTCFYLFMILEMTEEQEREALEVKE